MYHAPKSALRNIGLPSRREAIPRRKSLVKEMGGRNLGLGVANISIQMANTNKPTNITDYTGVSHEAQHVIPYSSSGEVSSMPSSAIKRNSVTRSHVNGPHYVLPLETPHQKIVPLGGGKKRHSARRKTRKTLRHSHRRE